MRRDILHRFVRYFVITPYFPVSLVNLRVFVPRKDDSSSIWGSLCTVLTSASLDICVSLFSLRKDWSTRMKKRISSYRNWIEFYKIKFKVLPIDRCRRVTRTTSKWWARAAAAVEARISFVLATRYSLSKINNHFSRLWSMISPTTQSTKETCRTSPVRRGLNGYLRMIFAVWHSDKTTDYLEIVRENASNCSCADCACEYPTMAIMSWLLIVCKKCAGKRPNNVPRVSHSFT